jgi:hypothetical protein
MVGFGPPGRFPLGENNRQFDPIITAAFRAMCVGTCLPVARAVFERIAQVNGVSTSTLVGRRLVRAQVAPAAKSATTMRHAGLILRLRMAVVAVTSVLPTPRAIRGARIAPAAQSNVAMTSRFLRLGRVAIAAASTFAAGWRIIPKRVSMLIKATGEGALTGYRVACGAVSITAAVRLLAKRRLLWSTAPAEPEPWATAIMQNEAWTPTTKQDASWTATSDDKEGWTSVSKQATTWTTQKRHG